MIRFLDLHHQYMDIRAEIDAAIEATIRESAFIGGPGVRAFEEDFAAYQQAKHCVGVGNGTDAMEIALESLDLPPGSEVIVPANTFIATSEAVTRSGHQVVFADVDPTTYTLDLSDVRRRIGSRTSAIMAVHLFGQPCDMDGLAAIAETRGLKILEDSAQAHGAEYRGRRVGAIGDIGTFSFYPGKNLGAYGDGGAITTDNRQLADRCRMIANHGRADKYNHVFEGRNSRLDGLQAAILRVKLRHLDSWLQKRRHVASQYFDGLADLDEIATPTVRSDVRHAFHLFVVQTTRRDALAASLNQSGVQTGIHYPVALPKLPAYRHLMQAEERMIANHLDGEILSLPIGEHLTTPEVTRVVEIIREFFRGRV